MNKLSALITSSLIAIVFSTLSLPAAAFSLKGEFASLASKSGGMSATVDSGSFRAGNMTGYHLGGVSVRVPVKKLNLVQVEHASISAGCHGLDINFGGMAFINGREIVDQLKQIAKGAPALIYSMTLKAIAAPLMNALNQLYDAMARLSNALKNSCELSMALIQGVDDMTGGFGGKLANKINEKSEEWSEIDYGKKLKESKLGQMASDFGGWANEKSEAFGAECLMMALSLGIIESPDSDKVCGKARAPQKTADESDVFVARLMAKFGWTKKAAEAHIKGGFGNETWNTLQVVGLAPSTDDSESPILGIPGMRIATLVQSMLGAKVTPHESDVPMVENNSLKSLGTGTNESGSAFFSPTITASEFLALFMCGTDRFVNSYNPAAKVPGLESEAEGMIEWCKEQLQIGADGKSNIKVLSCQSTSQAKTWMYGCIDVKEMSVRDADTLHVSNPANEAGMLFQTIELLGSAVAKAASGGAFEDDERAIIGMAPFPLYEIINIAASNPSVANQLIEANARILALIFSQASIKSIFDSVTSSSQFGSRAAFANAAILQEFLAMQEMVDAVKAQEIKKLTKFKDSIDILMHHVKTINSDVLKSTMHLGLNGTEFANSMNNMIGN